MIYKNLCQSFTITISIALTLALSSPSNAQSIAQSTNTIPAILKNPTVGQKVTLTGNILKKDRDEVGHSDYILTDGSNEIIIELEDENFKFNPKDTFQISGTVILESDAEHKNQDVPKRIEIQVKSIEKISDK